ncbi:unnamed protein product [Mytilus edulis]|uniref:Uncharacterized protein n=1 Tax=Mytilus edulis TaxID=6550 RepID=A0A8S3PQJ8_MYTED|nr:unnamed protein product [Mytilus edulis]
MITAIFSILLYIIDKTCALFYSDFNTDSDHYESKEKQLVLKLRQGKLPRTKSSSSMSEFLIIENIEKDVESPLPLTILETDIEESDSTGQQLSIKFGQTTPAVLKSSSFSELEGSISQEKKIEKDWFYKLNVTCDNYSLHLITDFNIQQKYSDLSEAIQCQGHQKLIIERRTCDKATTAFEKMYMHMISSKPLSISECIKQNFDLAVRFLLARNIAPDELCKHLHESMTENRNNISKAIGWSITKQFYKGMKTSDILNRVIDIWPGFRCRCARHCTKSHSRICSSEAVIIVEVDQLSNTIQGDFYGIPIEQSIQVPDNEPTQVQFQKEKTDLCSSSYSEIQMLTSVPGTIAEKCFQQHSKLTMIYIHPFKRTTMQLCCQINGVIPMGEPHFPKTLNGIDTCIAEGMLDSLLR